MSSLKIKKSAMLPEIWRRIASFVNEIEDLCSLASVGRFFYLTVRLNFREFCLRNKIYRLPGEMWCEAFREVPRRCYFYFDKPEPGLNCPPYTVSTTGNVALFTYEKGCLIISLDFDKPMVRYISTKQKVVHAQLDPKGETLTLNVENDKVRMSDVKTGQELASIDCPTKKGYQRSNECYFEPTTGRIFNTITRRWYESNLPGITRINGAEGQHNPHDMFVYVDGLVYMMDMETGVREEIEFIDTERSDYMLRFLNDNQHVLFGAADYDIIDIYEIPSGRLIHEHYSEDADTKWEVFNRRLLISTNAQMRYWDNRNKIYRRDYLIKFDCPRTYGKTCMVKAPGPIEDIAYFRVDGHDDPVYRQLIFVRAPGTGIQLLPFRPNNIFTDQDHLFPQLYEYIKHEEGLEVEEKVLSFIKRYSTAQKANDRLNPQQFEGDRRDYFNSDGEYFQLFSTLVIPMDESRRPPEDS